MAKTGRPRSFDRSVALDKALEAFWEHGFESTSVADLAHRIGIGPPSLYAAFGDKRTLYLEVLELYYNSFVEFVDRTLGEPVSRREAIAALLLGFARLYSRPGMPRGCMVNSMPVPLEEPLLVARVAEMRADAQARIRQAIRKAAEAGELQQIVQPDELADALWATVLGLSMRSQDGAPREELEAAARLAMGMWPAE